LSADGAGGAGNVSTAAVKHDRAARVTDQPCHFLFTFGSGASSGLMVKRQSYWLFWMNFLA
jgi:hypothetical protein